MSNHADFTVHNNTDAPIEAVGHSVKVTIPSGQSENIPFLETTSFFLFSWGHALPFIKVSGTEYLIPNDFRVSWIKASNSATLLDPMNTHAGDIIIAKGTPPILTEDEKKWVLEPTSPGATTISSGK